MAQQIAPAMTSKDNNADPATAPTVTLRGRTGGIDAK